MLHVPAPRQVSGADSQLLDSVAGNENLYAAYGLTSLFTYYSNLSVIQLTRWSDQTTADFYPDTNNTKLVTSTGALLSTWAAGSLVSVSTWCAAVRLQPLCLDLVPLNTRRSDQKPKVLRRTATQVRPERRERAPGERQPERPAALRPAHRCAAILRAAGAPARPDGPRG